MNIKDVALFVQTWRKIIDYWQSYDLERIYMSEDEFDCIWQSWKAGKLSGIVEIKGVADLDKPRVKVGQVYLFGVPIEQDFRIPTHKQFVVLNGGKSNVSDCPITEPMLPD